MLSKKLISRSALVFNWRCQPSRAIIEFKYGRPFSSRDVEKGDNKEGSKIPSGLNSRMKSVDEKRKAGGNPAQSIADRVKASFQKGGLLQRLNNEKSQRSKQKDPFHLNNIKVVDVESFNTGGGVKGKQKKKSNSSANKSKDAVKNNNSQPHRVQRGRIEEIAKPVDPVGDDSDSDEADEKISGEIVYERKQVHLSHKREQFERDLPHELPPKFTRNAPSVESQEDPFLKAKSPQSIAAFKALAAERLANKIENPIASTWVNYKEIRRQRRHERMNEIKEKKKIAKENKRGNKTLKSAGTIIYEIKIPHNGLTVRELSQRISMKMTDTIKKLADLGEIVDINAKELENLLIDPDVIELFALDLNLSVTREAAINRDSSEFIKKSDRVRADAVLTPRDPIISVMGHVDHGKTTLLDRLRHENVAAGEFGGITQKLSAFNVSMGGRSAVFLDTPGHAAFTGMRKSGASGADLVVLVVAIDDGVKPLTIEAAKVAQKSGCTIFVALTKVDKLSDEKDRLEARRKALTRLMEIDIVAEEFGGDIQVVEVSGKTGEGVSDLVEKLLLQADIMELKASPVGGAEGVVLDAKIEKGRGVMVDLLIKWGTLKMGDVVVVGNAYGKVKALLNDKGERVNNAGPSTPVRLLGLHSIPGVGQDIIGVDSENKAKKIADRRQRLEDARRIKELNRRAQAIEDEDDPTVIPVILKADSVGGLNALKNITDALSDRTNDVVIHIIGSSIGDVTPSDLSLAKLVKDGPPANILGFNINDPSNAIRTTAKQNDIEISIDSVIYRLEETLEDVMKSHMPEERISTLEGYANVLQLFDYKISSSKILKVAGLDVVSGALRDTSHHYFRVMRGDEVVFNESKGAQLKRFKDTVHEVKSGFECGLSLDHFEDFRVGDRIECYKFENVRKELVVHANKRVTYAPINKNMNEDDSLLD